MKTTPSLLLLGICLLPLFSSCEKDYYDAYVSHTVKVRSSSYSGVPYPAEFEKQANLVIMGDGYTTEDLMGGGAFETAANSLVSHLLSTPPYTHYGYYYLNVWYVYMASPERGVGHGSPKNSAFRCYFHETYPETIVFEDVNFIGMRKAADPFDVAKQAVPGINMDNTLVVVLVNDSQVGYTTGWSTQNYHSWISIISTCPEPNFERLVLREVGGKGFARLAQEDGDQYGPALEQLVLIKEGYNQYGFFANVDVTDNPGDPTSVRWSHFLSYPAKFPELGIFMGGFGYYSGVYHPDQDNVMLKNGSLRYDAPSREAIIKRFYQIWGDTYSMGTFIYHFVDGSF